MLCLICGYMVMLILRSIHKVVYYVGNALVFVAFVASYIQGTFLVGKLPELDGRDIDWQVYGSEQLKTLLVWGGLLLLVLLLLYFLKMEKAEKAMMAVSGGMTLMLMLTLVCLCITKQGV